MPIIEAVDPATGKDAALRGDVANGLHVYLTNPGDIAGGSGGGDASAANQVTEIAALQSIDAKVATAANQATANTSLASIDSKLSTTSGGGQGSKNVTTAGTPEKLQAGSQACSAVIITARNANTGKIAVGFSNTVRATAGAEIGMILTAGSSAVIPVDDVNKIYIDASVNLEGVSFTYIAA